MSFWKICTRKQYLKKKRRRNQNCCRLKKKKKMFFASTDQQNQKKKQNFELSENENPRTGKKHGLFRMCASLFVFFVLQQDIQLSQTNFKTIIVFFLLGARSKEQVFSGVTLNVIWPQSRHNVCVAKPSHCQVSHHTSSVKFYVSHFRCQMSRKCPACVQWWTLQEGMRPRWPSKAASVCLMWKETSVTKTFTYYQKTFVLNPPVFLRKVPRLVREKEWFPNKLLFKKKLPSRTKKLLSCFFFGGQKEAEETVPIGTNKRWWLKKKVDEKIGFGT